ncbi:MucR family transcriptional regulator [Mesorhizobium sp. WSM4312]|uniref:MucR family transcriptional regulator n=1 Tax=Mesorhizobium sp. WSM4312 TaxID=2029411 RepID=UPI001FE22571|nr:MucR family transcriptional regulator [Mesorhizobium sp. WSM4312]
MGEPPTQEPAINPKNSATSDYIICLEDGEKFKSLKCHLAVHHRLFPNEYRDKQGLIPDYLMVAPNYAVQRSSLAKAAGLGRKTQPAPAQKVPAKRKPRCLLKNGCPGISLGPVIKRSSQSRPGLSPRLSVANSRRVLRR